jgi:hypothetical protein
MWTLHSLATNRPTAQSQEDLIIPAHYTFYDFILNKARGKSGPLFNFDVHDDVRLLADATREKDESHAGKVVERSWYQRNKHIFPASRWEVRPLAYLRVRRDGPDGRKWAAYYHWIRSGLSLVAGAVLRGAHRVGVRPGEELRQVHDQELGKGWLYTLFCMFALAEAAPRSTMRRVCYRLNPDPYRAILLRMPHAKPSR